MADCPTSESQSDLFSLRNNNYIADMRCQILDETDRCYGRHDSLQIKIFRDLEVFDINSAIESGQIFHFSVWKMKHNNNWMFAWVLVWCYHHHVHQSNTNAHIQHTTSSKNWPKTLREEWEGKWNKLVMWNFLKTFSRKSIIICSFSLK